VEITGLSPEKIKSNLYLARQTIVKKLENYWRLWKTEIKSLKN
jgi:hypothetical protein